MIRETGTEFSFYERWSKNQKLTFQRRGRGQQIFLNITPKEKFWK